MPVDVPIGERRLIGFVPRAEESICGGLRCIEIEGKRDGREDDAESEGSGEENRHDIEADTADEIRFSLGAGNREKGFEK